MSDDIYAKPDLSKKVRFQAGKKKDEEDEEEERRNEDIAANIDNGVIYSNCWTERSTPPKSQDNTTNDQQQSQDIYAKPDLSKKVRRQTSEKKEEEDEEMRNADIYYYVSNVVTADNASPEKRTLPRAAAVSLGLLCLVLLAAVIVLLVLWIQDKNNWNTQKNQLTVVNAELTSERNKLRTNYSILEAKNNNLTVQRDDLQNQIEKHYCPDRWITFAKSCYSVFTSKKTWSESKKFCEDQGAHLVIISNTEEQEFVSSLNKQRVWIGLTDEETERVWKWVDGTEVNGTYWGNNQPDNYSPGENCAEIYTAFNSLNNWNDMKCSFSSNFICEKMLQ